MHGTTNVRHDAGGADTTETLILVNSLATTGELWDEVVTSLDGAVDVIRFDQRDRGGPLGDRPFSLVDLVDDLVAVLDSCEIAAAHVAGVSLGGMVALAAAVDHPTRVVSVTAMCCAARFRQDVWVERAAQVRAHGVAPLTAAVMDRWFTRDFQSRHAETLVRYRDMFSSTSDAGYAHASDLLATSDLVGTLQAIAAPTLVVRGEHDTANPPGDQDLIVSAVPGARLEQIDGAAHLAPASHPEQVAGLLLDQVRLASPTGG